MTESHLRAGKPKKTKREFGSIRVLPSGRVQARWRNPDGKMVPGPHTFKDKKEARTFLKLIENDLITGVYQPGENDDTFSEWAQTCISRYRAIGRAPRYIEESERILRKDLEPVWGSYRLTKIFGKDVDRWHAQLKPDAPTMRAKVYDQFSRMLNAAVKDSEQRLKHNPCKIPGAANVEPKREPVKLEPDQLVALVDAFPDRYRFLALLTCWVSMRFSEFTEIRRGDITLSEDGTLDVLDIRRGITRTKGEDRVPDVHIGPPKARSKGRVVIPPHIHDELITHLDSHTGPGADALLFPSRQGRQLSYSTFQNIWQRAVRDARKSPVFDQVPHLVPHDLRHAGASYAGDAGASLAELMQRMRHKSVDSAMRYQHASLLRDRALAERMSATIAGRSARQLYAVRDVAGDGAAAQLAEIARMRAELERLIAAFTPRPATG